MRVLTEDIAVGHFNWHEEQRIRGWNGDRDNAKVLARKDEDISMSQKKDEEKNQCRGKMELFLGDLFLKC